MESSEVKVPFTMEELAELCFIAEQGLDKMGSSLKMMKHLGHDIKEMSQKYHDQSELVLKIKTACGSTR